MKFPPSLLVTVLALSVSGLVSAAPFPDPAPPQAMPVKDQSAPAPAAAAFDRLTFHHAPKALSPEAKTCDFPRLLGPNDDATSPETHLLHTWPAEGPSLVWEARKGDSYTSPAIEGRRVVVFSALDQKETIDCLDSETGQRYWTQDYSIRYRDRYGFANGPRGGPTIGEGRVVTLGVTAMLTCLDLKTGQQLWQRDLQKDFHVPQEFFGHGSAPLILDGKVIVNVGGKGEEISRSDSMEDRCRKLATPGLSVGAFDLATGKLVWGVKDEWGASYASPVATTLHEKKVVLVFAGGESKPATGGLFCLDPEDGTVYERFPWRADDYISATAQSPVVVPGTNRVFISTCYPKEHPLGGVMLEFDEHLKAKELWSTKGFSIHFMTPVVIDGYLYGIDGEHETNAQLVCYESATGKEVWRKDVQWQDEELAKQNGGRPVTWGIQRASLLRVDGKVLCLGETGSLLWLDLSPIGYHIDARAQLFYAPSTWCLPAVSRGLLYIMQNASEQVRGSVKERIACYDLRAP